METPKPIPSQLLRDENEVQNIFEFFKYKIEERENKNKYGGIMSKGMCTTVVANRARLALPTDIVQYIEKSLTKKEMEKNRVGRKKNRFTKRSETVKSNQAVTYLPELFEKDLNNISVKDVSPAVIETNYKHLSFDLNVPIGFVPKLNYHCSECDEKYESELLLNHHFKIAHGKVKLFKCKLCCKKFQIEQNLQRHVALYHGKQTLYDGVTIKPDPETKYESISFDLNDPKPKLKYQYLQLTNVLESPSNFVHHFKNVHEETKLFICKFCEKGFEREPNLKNHVSLKHTEEKTEVSILSSGFSCSMCNCNYLKEDSLKRHILWCRKSHRPVVPGDAGGAMEPPNFGISVNPISTKGGRLCPPNYTGTPEFIDPPMALNHA